MAGHSPIPDNTAVSWDGTTFGWLPTLSSDAESRVLEGHAAVAGLLSAMSDADRFVTAHVLLTKVTGMRHESFPTWNGLKLDMRADNTLIIEPAQRDELAQRWQKYFQTTPRPPTLP